MSQAAVNTARDRSKIGVVLRALRESRRWSQTELADHLGTSQSNISQIERGRSSLTAEQFLAVLRLFNVPTTAFVDDIAPRADPRINALARHGARHLRVDPTVVPDERSDIHDVVVDAINLGDARLLTALAPVVVSNVETLNFAKLAVELDNWGRRQRLYWVLDNVLEATRVASRTARQRDASRYRWALRRLQRTLAFADGFTPPEEDIVDPTVRSKEGVARLEAERSPVSRRWRILSALQVEDFLQALRQADAD